MRGFRGSRAAQNHLSARFGKHGFFHPNSSQEHQQNHHQAPQEQAQKQELPEWLKTTETKQKEFQEERKLKLASSQHSVSTPIPAQTQTTKRPQLRLVSPQETAAVAPKKKAPAKKPRAKKLAAASTTSDTKKRTPVKKKKLVSK